MNLSGWRIRYKIKAMWGRQILDSRPAQTGSFYAASQPVFPDSASLLPGFVVFPGGDLITINEKYVPQFKYQNRGKFIFASNHPIQLAEDDEAFWERMVFLPFQYSVSKPEQDMDLLKKLLKEKQ